MNRIGIRELRQHASRYLRRVAQGEVIEVTDRGRPVARIVPLERRSAWERLESAGRLRVAEGPVTDAAPPLPPRGKRLPSQVLGRMRAGER